MKIKRDLTSKLIDGIGAGVILLMLAGLISFLRGPFDRLLGRPGLLAYTLGVLALAIYFLDRSAAPRTTDTRQGWAGMVSGVLGWNVIQLSVELGGVVVPRITEVLLFLMIGLVAVALWKNVLTVGVQFFTIIILLNWSISLLRVGVETLSPQLGYIQNIWRIIGVLCVPTLLIMLAWMFYYSERRMQRLWVGLWVWFFIALMGVVFFGNLFTFYV